MAEFDEKGLKAHIKDGDFLPVYLICGDEDYLKKFYCDAIVSKNVSPEFESFNYEKFQGKNLDLESVFEASAIMPMMSDKRCLVVEDFKLEGISERDYSLLKAYAEDAPETSIVIFLQKKADFSLAKAKKAADLIKKVGAVCVLNKRTGNDLLKPLISSAAKQKCVLSTEMARYLVFVSGDNFNVLINELNKVCSFTGEGEITKNHIDAVAVKTDDAKIYALTKALFVKNFDLAYEVLHSLLRQKIEPEYILGTIISSYVDLYRAKVSVVSGERADSLSGDFGYRNTAFRLTNADRDSRKTDIATIRKCLEELSKADTSLKYGSGDPIIVLEQLMVKLFLISNGEKV